MAHALKLLEQIAGALLMSLVLADVFLTVIYARIGTGIISPRLARATWYAFRAIVRPSQAHRGKLLSLCGPSILVILVLVWGFLLVIGAALIIHPHLRTTIKATSGETQTDFLTAIYAAGSSIAVVGSSDYEPQNGSFKMFYLLNSLIGISMLSLTLTYLMQVYSALLRRNAVGLSLHVGKGLQGDAAELVKGIGPQGHFEIGYLNLVHLADSLQQMKEAHHFHPVLFYFRFEEPYYSVSQITNVALDSVTLIRSALDQERYHWLVESGAVSDIWESARLLLVRECLRKRWRSSRRATRCANSRTLASTFLGGSSYIRSGQHPGACEPRGCCEFLHRIKIHMGRVHQPSGTVHDVLHG